MIPYFTMKDYYDWAHQHPELGPPSEDDINRARVFAGLPAETQNETLHYYTDPRP